MLLHFGFVIDHFWLIVLRDVTQGQNRYRHMNINAVNFLKKYIEVQTKSNYRHMNIIANAKKKRNDEVLTAKITNRQHQLQTCDKGNQTLHWT